MSYLRKDRITVDELPKGAKTVSQYAKDKGCSYTNIFKLANNGKINIVIYSGVLFVVNNQ